MARKKKIKEKSPVSLRFKKLANGGYSLYLDIYTNGKRYYEFLKLYLVEETTDEARVRNVNTMTAANAIKSQRILEIANGKANIKNKSNLAKVLLSDWMEHYTAHKKRVGCSDNFLTCIIHRGNFNGYTFLNMLLHMKTNQHSDVSRGLSKKILP